MLGIALLPFYGLRFGLSVDRLPTRKLVGWRELSESLRQREPRHLADAGLLITDRYTTASALAHGLQRPPGDVFTVALGTGRMNQYDLWAREDLPGRVGSDALVVLDTKTDPRPLLALFDRLEPLLPLAVAVKGMEPRHYSILMAYGYNGSALPQPSRR